ncbi:BgTH12-03246 [Blumeria graminis f. sp. triticale]|uniref:F-actin-capping protein subunit alpha n=1 Tax=Blumeria graminis f. sp. triticale TaxID=1689686 RepID=A0A9W4GFH5_BLUGR|nr:BgTH12-03246 [Blumeria graminis f. sp. triticale]
MSAQLATVSAFIKGAPPGELPNVVSDIKILTNNDPKIISELGPVFQSYNENQFTTVKLPDTDQNIIVSAYNSLGEGRYYDVNSCLSFSFDHETQKPSEVQSYMLESNHSDFVKSISKNLRLYLNEHYSNASCGVYPTNEDSEIAILIVANQYSPRNFWNGQWKSLYIYSPATSCLSGQINVDVHYYEDGNVRLLTSKPVSLSVSHDSTETVLKEIKGLEKKYQEELTNGFQNLSEGAFRGLRRQLPVTRQKVEWDKIAGYRLGQDIGGGSIKK